MTQFEKATLAAINAFMQHYTMVETINSDLPPPENHFEEPQRSNGIPVCSRHGRAMKQGKFGYFCSTKESDPRFANKNGWCNAKG